DRLLSTKHLVLGPIPANRHEFVLRLLQVFHNVGVASIILRLVHPDQFGVFSTPVLYLVQINCGATVDLYLAYCNELANWAKRFEDDLWIQRRRAAHVIGPFLRRHGRLQLARILLDEDARLAGKIASDEYERLLGVASLQLWGRPLPNKKGAAERLIDELQRR